MANRRKRHEEHEEHENHERWLLTYADMITLLMVLFIVLFAISQVDLAKFHKLKEGLRDSFGNKTEAGVLDGQQTVLDGQGNVDPVLLSQAGEALAAKQALDAAVAADQQELAALKGRINDELAKAGLADDVQLHIETRGLVVTILADKVLFEPGSADLTGHGSTIVDRIADVLVPLSRTISVEGHTDDQPISTSQYASNWELSTGRATSVLRALIARYGMAPDRLSAAGYGDTRPIAPNSTPEGRAANRRVEIVVHAAIDNEGT
jgi:chemotaxis protein MotB